MNEELKQPPYDPSSDGEMSIRRNSDDSMTIFVEHADGSFQTIKLTLHNAFLAFGLLSLMLGIKLPDEVGKAIQIPRAKALDALMACASESE